ncbi:MAG: SUMF1/EgtB/PvdO family nonheme iron enzyme [Anaerolineae bacterium]|nr:SUMF1/EgtB/PvdO family nonheme iron enzyme [Anaerolineae bacterium]
MFTCRRWCRRSEACSVAGSSKRAAPRARAQIEASRAGRITVAHPGWLDPVVALAGGPSGHPGAGAGRGDRRVVRGGSFNNNRNNARCAYRNRNNPNNRNNNSGFRVVVSHNSPPPSRKCRAARLAPSRWLAGKRGLDGRGVERWPGRSLAEPRPLGSGTGRIQKRPGSWAQVALSRADPVQQLLLAVRQRPSGMVVVS